jgi:hypothetical protein
MVPKTVPVGYLSIRETFERFFDAKFPEWSALASAGKGFGFGGPRDPAVKFELPEDRHFQHEREITDFILDQFCNGGLAIFLHSADGRTEQIVPRELAVPFFQSRISDENFGIGANDGRTVCVLRTDTDRLAAQFAGRRRGRRDQYDWTKIKKVWDEIGPREGRAEASLDRLSADGWEAVPDVSTLRRKERRWARHK